ncbi:hypothetical protein QE364_003178 [Nocardioides zeae]|uniref:Uncharacterized protein n=2 Tax=Nocardioides zeae TaxID=1457234 RepID=A0ACC6IL92_9ACTN|nr:hypothetical protein [Nocardioides zeae]MDQ1106323.1 hypothetical protein [Nocardioides zeae]MDR6173991.1 hypothetical protein [Nocardioides zeae]MDR6211454.1 hypothetical protein [Nocardioides zeae]
MTGIDVPSGPPPYVPPALPPASFKASNRRRSGGILSAISLALAAVLLVGSLLAAKWVVEEAPGGRASGYQDVASTSSYEFYGGDAYTGIQNTAADTEHTVANATNALGEVARAQASAANDRWEHLWAALAILLVVIGAANFVLSLQRFAAHRASAAV